MAAALPPASCFSIGSGTMIAFCSAHDDATAPAADGPAPPPPEHVAIDIPAAAGAAVAEPDGAPTAPPEEHVAVDIPEEGARRLPKKPTRAVLFVRMQIERLCIAYMFLVAPALVVAALVWGASPFLQLMVFLAGVFAAAFFTVREAEEKEAQALQAEAKG